MFNSFFNIFKIFKNNELALSFTKQIALDIANEIAKQFRHPNPNKQHLTWNPATHRWIKRKVGAAGKAKTTTGKTEPVKAHPKKAKAMNDKLIRHCSGLGYIPYINLLNQILI